jgi:AP-4 complex subunit mu-1
MISQFFVVSMRGDTILHKDCKCPSFADLSVRLEMEHCRLTTTQDMFLERVGITNSFNDDNEHRHSPFFVSFNPNITTTQEANGIQFAHVKKKELYFVISSLKRNLSPSLALELLESIVNVSDLKFLLLQRIHDFCGGIDEELLRMNFVLIYELMDEIIDYGFPQFTDSQHLKNLVNTDAEKLYSGTLDYLVSQIPLEKLKLVDSVSEKDSERSIRKPTNDIFIEINEKISACFNTNGFAIRIKVNGLVLVKNYIIKKINCKILFNEMFNVVDDSILRRGEDGVASGFAQNQFNQQNRQKIRITQIHETVDWEQLAQMKQLKFAPPLGQSIALQYECEGSFNMLPIKVFPTFIARQQYRKLDLNLKVFNKLPANLRCKGLTITFRVPANVERVYFKD